MKKVIKPLLSIIKDLENFGKICIKERDIKYTYHLFLFHLLWETKYGQKIVKKLDSLKLFYPVFIEVEVTTRCNLKCIICEHTYWKEPIRDMTFEEFKLIVDQFPRLCWIGLTGIGESFLNKDFLKMLEYVKKKKVFIEVYDTFYFINKEIAQRLVDLKVERIFASIDAAKKETYEKIRVGSNFERVISNVETLFKIKKEKNSKYPMVNFHFIVNKINYNEIPEFIEMVDKIRHGFQTEIQFTRMLHNFPEIKDLFIEVPLHIIKEAEKIAKRKGINLIWNQNVPLKKPSIKDCTAWSMPFIFVNGDVICCCASNEANKRDFQKKYSFGNIFEKPFKKIWFSENYKNFRKQIRLGKVPIQCIDCPIFEIWIKK
jgi:radical SAM protein with 4Fe4S-binding SPASM domain